MTFQVFPYVSMHVRIMKGDREGFVLIEQGTNEPKKIKRKMSPKKSTIGGKCSRM